MDTVNKFMVGMRGDVICLGLFGRYITQEDAINLAAWLAALTDAEQVAALVQEIQET